MINHWNSLLRNVIKLPSFEVLNQYWTSFSKLYLRQNWWIWCWKYLIELSDLYHTNNKMNRKDHSSSTKNRKCPTWHLNLWSQSPACSSQTRSLCPRESLTASVKASESWLCWKYSPLVMELRKNIWFIYMQLSPFPIPTLLLLSNIHSKITCLTWKPRISRQGFVKTSIWGWYKYCTVQIYNIQSFLESYNLNVFFWLQLQVLAENCAVQD